MSGHFIIALTDIIPEDVLSDEELDKLKVKIVENLKPLNVTVETCKYIPIAFGLKKIEAKLIIPESADIGTEPIENAISSIEGVQRAEIIMATRT